MKRLTGFTHHWPKGFLRLIGSRWGRINSSLIVAAALTLVGFACYWTHLNLATTALLYLILVVLTSRLVGFAPSVVAASIAALCLVYLAPPRDSFRIEDPFDIVAIATFFVISLVLCYVISKLEQVARESRSNVNRRLVDAEQRERARIARELHDDINQRLSLLTSHLQSVEQNLSASAAELKVEIGQTSQQMECLATDIQALSHRLHSSKLEYIGLAAAAAGFCRELSEQNGVKIDFRSENVPRDLPEETSFCLFRVLQEALQNAVKHSRSQQFRVWLTKTSDQLELTVHDAGVGFDSGEALKGSGLGLTSMKERLKLVDGVLSIDSQPRHGATIYARVEMMPPQSNEVNSSVPA
jgi:signal transduction histidine kinase